MAKDKISFTVVGAGAWGTALALILAENQHQVSLYTHEPRHRESMIHSRENAQYLPGNPFPRNIRVTADLAQDLERADHVLVAVPSHAFRSVLKNIQAHLLPRHGVIWATKGLDPDSGQFLHEVAHDELSHDHPLAVITGPSFAKEVGAKQPTAVVIAGTNDVFNRQMQEAFQDRHFRTYLCDDFIGAQIGGAVKNVMAIAVGIADGLGFGANAKAALITRALAEMTRFGVACGAHPKTLSGLSGLGDLILTCSDNLSRNRRFGLLVGQGKSFEQAQAEVVQVIEGIGNCEIIYNLAQKMAVEMPIVEQMYQLLYQGASAEAAVMGLLSREAGVE